METRKKYRVKSRTRFTIFIAAIMIIAVTGINSVLGFNTASGESEHKYVTVEVLPGESLWDIATVHMSSDMDKREAVHLIKKANNLDDSMVEPGQHIKVPVS